MCPGGYPIQESQNWQSAFLPGIYQGTYINTKHQEIEKLIEHIKNKFVSTQEQRQQLDLLSQLNEQHARRRAQDEQMEARIQSFELAYRMQMDATEAFDISKEPEPIRKMYGDRKSTRLNSSHGYISYAVFCLKKKKKHNITNTEKYRRYISINPLTHV